MTKEGIPKEALVKDLNAIVLGPSIYDADRSSEVERRQETQDLLDGSPQGEDLARLNRALSKLKRPPNVRSAASRATILPPRMRL